jgi:ABC-type branched-subunit amino acid transport system ATPase component
VLGPNGAGKTTLLRSIIGLVPPAEGEIRSEEETISMDEPSLGLSSKLVDQTFAIVRAMHREGASILPIEQNARQALAVCHRGYILQKGAINLSGSREELASDERVQRAYFAADRNPPPTPAELRHTSSTTLPMLSPLCRWRSADGASRKGKCRPTKTGLANRVTS